MRHRGRKIRPDPSTFAPCGIQAAHELLTDLKVQYWLDSGSLLGLVRNGCEIPWDNDIDVGIWETEASKLNQLVKYLPGTKYKVTTRSYQGNIYGFTIAERSKKSFRPIHIHVYFREGDIAWSPQTVVYKPMKRKNLTTGFAPWPRTRKLLHHFNERALNRGSGSPLDRIWAYGFCLPVWASLVLIRNRLERQVWAGLWPYSALYAMYTWVIPASYFERLEQWPLSDTTIPVPSRVREYLGLRYGKWETPVSDWCYWTDDGCILALEPSAALESLTEMKKNDSRLLEKSRSRV